MHYETIVVKPLALVLAWEGKALAGLSLDWAEGHVETQEKSPHAGSLKKALARFVFGKDPIWPELPFKWDEVSPFARRVLETLELECGSGETLSYGELARLAGKPGAARAVGRVMAHNPWPLIYPCHRVIGSNGKLTGFGGVGLKMKGHLLELEGGGE